MTGSTIFGVAVFVGLAALAFAIDARACTCNISPPVCFDYWRTDAIFVGTVRDRVVDQAAAVRLVQRSDTHELIIYY